MTLRAGATSATIDSVTVFSDRLRSRIARSGAAPLITYYDDSTGERTELSAISFGNWVDKTAGLIVDELLLDQGTPVRLDLARTHPVHWVTLVWVAASWRAGCPVIIGGDAPDGAGVEVVGPTAAFDDHAGSVERVACSLHPFGLGFDRPLPVGVIDYGVEVRAQPDSFAGPTVRPTEQAWVDQGRRLTHGEIADVHQGPADRTLIVPGAGDDPWSLVDEALIRPVTSGGSVVIALGTDPERRKSLIDSERVSRTVG